MSTRYYVSTRGLSMATCNTLHEHWTHTAFYDPPGKFGARQHHTRFRRFKQQRAAMAWARRYARDKKQQGKPHAVTVLAVHFNGLWCYARPVAKFGPSCQYDFGAIGEIAARGKHLDAATRGGIGLSGNPHVNPRWHKIAKGRKGTTSAHLSATAKTS